MGIAEVPDLCGWETFIWRNNSLKGHEEIVYSHSTKGNAQTVVELHAELYNKIRDNGGEWEETDNEN